MILAPFGFFKSQTTLDVDATALINAVQGAGDTLAQSDKDAIYELFTGLKSDSIYTSLKALYLMVGSTATSHKWNAVDPRDLDAAHRIEYINPVTHAATGIKALSSTADVGAINLHIQPNIMAQDSAGISAYSRDDMQYGTWDIAYVGSNYFWMYIRSLGDLCRVGINSADFPTTSNANSKGFFTSLRTSSVLTTMYRNGVSIATSSEASHTPDAGDIKALRDDGGGLGGYTREFCTIAFHNGLSDTQQALFFKRIQIFNIRLQRAVGNHGTLSSGATYASDVPSVLAVNGFCSILDGTNDCITLANSITLSESSAISIWCKPSTFDKILLGKSDSLNDYLYFTSSSIIEVNILGTAKDFTVPVMSTGTWYNIIIVRNAGTTHLYLNGVESSSGGQAQSGNWIIDQLGRYYDGVTSGSSSYFWNGKISSVRKFDSVLTSTDISNLVAGLEPVTNSSFHLKLNESSGTTAWDYII